MPNCHPPAGIRKGLGQCFCHCDAAVLPAGTAKPDREIGFALVLIGGQQKLDQIRDLVPKGGQTRIPCDIGLYRRIAPVSLSQLRIPMRVFQEPAVKYQVQAARQPAFVRKGLHRDRQPPFTVGQEPTL